MRNKRISKIKKSVKSEFKPLFHLAPHFGWMNDPNGFCYYKGHFHLFYQHNPYSSRWGRMHWGHATSKDLIKWHHQPIALSPDTKNDNFLGCFSGSAIEKNNTLYLLYTGVKFLKQQQMIASSNDGITFTKQFEPIISARNRPPFCVVFSFRDPKVFKKDNSYFAVIGAAYKKGRQIALYKSSDLYSWKFKGSLIKEETKKRGIFECPDLIEFKNRDLLIYSIMYTETKCMEYQNLHSSVYLIGNTDYEKYEFSTTGRQKELDYGCDFYAPQTTTTPDGRVIMVAWMQMWFRSIPTSYLKHNFAGMMTLPRELFIDNDTLFQKPVEEVYSHFEINKVKMKTSINDKISFENIKGECFILDINVEDINAILKIFIRQNNSCHTLITLQDKTIIFNRENSGHKIKGSKMDDHCNIRYCNIQNEKVLTMQIISDKSSIEIFINNRYCMSNTVYPYDGADGICFQSPTGCDAKIVFSPLKSS